MPIKVALRAEVAAQPPDGNLLPVEEADRVDPAGTVARAGLPDKAGRAGTVTDIADLQADNLHCACYPG